MGESGLKTIIVVRRRPAADPSTMTEKFLSHDLLDRGRISSIDSEEVSLGYPWFGHNRPLCSSAGVPVRSRSGIVRFLSSLSAVLTVIGSVILTSSGAGASGLGCDNSQITDEPVSFNATSVEMTLPYGYLCHLMESRGKEISNQRAAYTSNASIYGPLVGEICNWRIDFVYYDTKGDEYMRDKGETVNNCKGASRVVAKNKTVPQYGSTCAELFVDGKVRLTQCHSMNE
jgi:hypothetical protein